jgi:hypothetical protein
MTETILLDETTEPAVYEYFLDRPRKLKFDEYCDGSYVKTMIVFADGSKTLRRYSELNLYKIILINNDYKIKSYLII